MSLLPELAESIGGLLHTCWQAIGFLKLLAHPTGIEPVFPP